MWPFTESFGSKSKAGDRYHIAGALVGWMRLQFAGAWMNKNQMHSIFQPRRLSGKAWLPHTPGAACRSLAGSRYVATENDDDGNGLWPGEGSQMSFGPLPFSKSG